MTSKDREAQILRVKSTSIQPELDSALEETLRTAVVSAVKTTLEAVLEEELSADLAGMASDKPRRSGYFSRGLDTQYGHVSDLQVPKLRQAPISQTPEILIVDGVWGDIQYTLDEYKLDRSGHRRQRRQAEERVILAALAVWADGSHEIVHYEIAKGESETEWSHFFQQLIARGLDPQVIKLVVSDGTLGLPKAMKQQFPQAKQQRCITHKVRGLERYLEYAKLPTSTLEGEVLRPEAGKRQRRHEIKYEIKSQAYEIYKAETFDLAQQRWEAFGMGW